MINLRYVIDCKSVAGTINDKFVKLYYDNKDFSSVVPKENIHILDDAEMTKDEVQAVYRRLVDMQLDEKLEAFGRVINERLGVGESITHAIISNLSVDEINMYIDHYYNKLCVGDEVITPHSDSVIVLATTGIDKNDRVFVMHDDGSTSCTFARKDLKRTGRHFTEIEDVLKKMKNSVDK